MKQLLNTIALAACFTIAGNAAKAQQAAAKAGATEAAPVAVTTTTVKSAAPQKPSSVIPAETILPAGITLETVKDRVAIPAAIAPAAAETAAKQTTGTAPVQTPGVKQ